VSNYITTPAGPWGGAIYAYAGAVIVSYGSVFVGNKAIKAAVGASRYATVNGGAVMLDGSNLANTRQSLFVNTTFLGNAAVIQRTTTSSLVCGKLASQIFGG
jgi:hypothetical protein